MDTENLKHKTKLGFIWSAIDRLSSQAIQFVIGILLARILEPSDFGIIGMLTIFLAISNSVINGGFVNALIQKKDCTQTDYSTIFYFNVLAGAVTSIVLCLTAPYIADFYGIPVLDQVTRVMSVTLLLNSLIVVQTTKLTKELNFKIQAKVRFACNLVAGIVALICAEYGLGFWVLVIQSVLSSFLICISFWVLSRWLPSLVFSVESFKKLFAFGSNLLITGLYGPIFDNLTTLIIGKFYSPDLLGLYSRADTLARYPSASITGIVGSVSYPVLSKMQDDTERLRSAYRRLIRTTYFIVFPLMGGLLVSANSLVELVLGVKWIPCVKYLQILCVAFSFYPLCAYNINALLVKGKANLHLRLDFIKKIVNIVVLFGTAIFGIEYICYGYVFMCFFSWIITAYYSGNLLDLTLVQQMKDLLPSLTITLVMCLGISTISIFIMSSVQTLLFQILVGTIVYMWLSCCFNKEDFVELRSFMRN